MYLNRFFNIFFFFVSELNQKEVGLFVNSQFNIPFPLFKYYCCFCYGLPYIRFIFEFFSSLNFSCFNNLTLNVRIGFIYLIVILYMLHNL